MEHCTHRGDAHRRIGRYLLAEELGRGGMGAVHRAWDPALSRWVAVKLPNAEASGHGLWGSRARLLREAQALASVQHPGIVEIYDVVLADPQAYLTMRLVPGRTLRQRPDLTLAPGGDADGFLRVIADVGAALVAAHAAGVVHRDVKPDNLMIGDDGHVTLIDFGLARAWHRGRATRPDVDSGVLHLELSAGIERPGTPGYTAPELLAGAAPHPSADQYSLCRILLERGGPQLARRPALAQAIHHGLAVDPARRHPSMQALLDALRRALRRRSVRSVAGVPVRADHPATHA